MENEVKGMQWAVTFTLVVGLILQISMLLDLQGLKHDVENMTITHAYVKDVRGDYY